jgi:uncharacterized protein (TIGR00725 family)
MRISFDISIKIDNDSYYYLIRNKIYNHQLKKIQIGVIGYNHDDSLPTKTLNLAYDVGKEIAKKKATLICGGLGGVMEYACRGAKDNGGLTVGIVPQEDHSKANKFCDIVICTGIGKSRDFVVAYSSDGIISVGGGVGTLIELCVGYMAKKTMVSIENSGGVSDIYGGNFLDERKRIKIEKSASPSFAVDFIFQKLCTLT